MRKILSVCKVIQFPNFCKNEMVKKRTILTSSEQYGLLQKRCQAFFKLCLTLFKQYQTLFSR